MTGATFFDAAVQLPNDSHGSWKTLLFQGDRALILNWDQGIGDGAVKITNLEKKWSTLANTPYAQGVDAAVQLPNDSHGSWQTLLFKGPRLLQLNWDAGIQYEGLITEYGGSDLQWRQLSPTVFANGVDTAMQLLTDSHGRWVTVLFKFVPQQDNTFDQFVHLNWNAGIELMGSIHDYEKQWNTVPRSYGSGFSALEVPDDNGSYRTMLFKGANCYYFNWESGRIYEGPITEIGWRWADAYNALTS